eukprot:6199130-Pleurochrysis_carterae.AAC.3
MLIYVAEDESPYVVSLCVSDAVSSAELWRLAASAAYRHRHHCHHEHDVPVHQLYVDLNDHPHLPAPRRLSYEAWPCRQLLAPPSHQQAAAQACHGALPARFGDAAR